MGIFTGWTGGLIIAAIVLGVLSIAAVLLITVSYGRKHKDDHTEDFEYYPIGDDGQFIIPRDEIAADVAEEAREEEIIPEPAPEPAPVIAAVPEPAPALPEEEKTPPIAEGPMPEPEPVKEPAPEPVSEPAKPEPVPEPAAPEPVPEPEPEEEIKTPVVPKKSKKVVKKKQDDWSNYDGEYDGYYYDPEDGCYYEGEAPEELREKLAAHHKEYEEAIKKSGKKVIIKKIKPPFATLDTPKHPRKAPKPVDGFDEAVIYGKFVIEHVGDEYFYTLYNNAEKALYYSGNYASKEYCERAIRRFKTHALVGTFAVDEVQGGYCFILNRKSYNHRGEVKKTRVEAAKQADDVKRFATTDIIREQ